MDLMSFKTIQDIRSGVLSFQKYLDELEAYFGTREPDVLSYIPEDDRFERLREEARALQAQYPDPESRPPLYGVLVGVKDIFHVDGFLTRGGSNVPPEAIQGPEAKSVSLLKEAGALILGKTVTTEFAYFGPGPTRNPHNPAHTPGGSSSGSAAAVGARLTPLAFGTQTIGSVTRPASFCGVIGYKPSYERISRAGVIPLSESLDHIGVFTVDLQLAEAAAGLLVADWQSMWLDRDALVLGIPEGPYLAKADAEMQTHFANVVDKLASAGHIVKRIPAMDDVEEIIQRHQVIVAADAAATHAEWFAKYPEGYHFKTVELIERGQKISTDELIAARKGRKKLRDELQAIMNTEGLDLWISPSAVGAAPEGLDSTGDPVMNLPWTHAGLPTLGFPAGKNSTGMSLGLQLAARFGQDEILFKMGALIEKGLAE